MAQSRIDVFAPLQEFVWSGDLFELIPGVRIVRYEQSAEAGRFDGIGDGSGIDAIGRARHWCSGQQL